MAKKLLFPKKLPKLVTALGATFKVVLRPMEESFGECHYFEDTIFINSELPLKEQWRTLFHEWGHMVLYRNGFNFSGAPKAVIEMMVETIANALLDMVEAGVIKL